MARNVARLAASGVLILVGAIVSSRAAPSSGKPAAKVTCAFSNPGYSGWCRQPVDVPGGKTAQSACQDVLTCLNSPQCTKSYCNTTSVRGAWKLEKIEPPSGPPVTKRP